MEKCVIYKISEELSAEKLSDPAAIPCYFLTFLLITTNHFDEIYK
jgi:hypothetical protein